MNVHHQMTSLCDPDAPLLSLDEAPELVAMECAALRRTYPIDREEVVRRVKGGLGYAMIDRLQGVHLSPRAFAAVLQLVAEAMVAQHEHGQPTIQGRTRR